MNPINVKTVIGFNLFLLFIALLPTSCKKFLDQKPNVSDLIPTTLNELQTLLDNTYVINANGASCLSELGADNYYLATTDYQSYALSSNKFIQSEVQHYIWYGQALPSEYYWDLCYQNPIYYANIVLDQLPMIKKSPGEEEKYNMLRGSALFYRAFSFHSLAQLFCKPYSQDNADELGIVLRLTSNVNAKSTRSTVQKTYDQIIADLKEAANLLPNTSTFPTRPSKTAAYAALARVYLSMRDYSNAGQYANLALQQYGTLIDYNSLVPVNSPPIERLNQEVIFHNFSQTFIITDASVHKIDSTLYQSYDTNDLRKTVFFGANTGTNAGTYFFRGSYNGTELPYSLFDGLATDELYLIRAECAARSGNKNAAIADLNTLMIKRWSNNGSWVPFTATDAIDALNKVLTERRKELIWRGLRWSDIRRLNLEGANITLKRVIAGTEYTLPPNDLRGTLLIPWEEINRSGIAQNPR